MDTFGDSFRRRLKKKKIMKSANLQLFMSHKYNFTVYESHNIVLLLMKIIISFIVYKTSEYHFTVYETSEYQFTVYVVQ